MKPYYEHGGITIYHGDCREVMAGGVIGGVIITDPPYGASYASNYVGPTTTAHWMRSKIAGDDSLEARDFVLTLQPEWAVFGLLGTSPRGTRDTLIWDKGPASGMGDLSWPWKRSWECVFLAGVGWRGRRDEGVLKGMHVVTRASMGRLHPNEKPVSLVEHLVSKHPEGIVLDPFMGSGTTLVAAKNLGRKAIGIEIEERYCEIAAKRLAQEILL